MAAARYIIRVANTDLNGEKQIAYALCKVKGISVMLSQAICNVAGIDPAKKAGDLTEAEEKHLNDLLKDLPNSGIPQWMLNRRKDPETGEDMHLIGSDVAYVKENDIKFLRKIRTYKGLRHAVGLPVRGQRTKSNFRKNKTRGSSKRKK